MIFIKYWMNFEENFLFFYFILLERIFYIFYCLGEFKIVRNYFVNVEGWK